MNRWLSLGLVLLVSSWVAAEAPLPTGPGKGGQPDEYPDGLPKHMTPAERLIPIEGPTQEERDSRSPPSGLIYCPPEYEPCEGVFMAWEGYTSVLTAMIVPMTTHDPSATVFVVVDSPSEQDSAYATISSTGADMNYVEFIVRVTDSVWIRDYGPRFIYEDGLRAIIDHTYNRPRPNDNALNDYISILWGIAEYDIPLEHGGGNFHLFSNGDAFMSSLILAENPGLSEQDVKDLYSEYQNLDLTIYPGFPTSFDSTRHIDMWMMPLADDTIIIGEYSSSTGAPYTITENAVADLVSRGYTVYRTPGWRSGGTHYTYTNAVILNDLVFISTFDHSNDAVALAVFQSALPDYTVIQVDSSSIILASGALHCVAMHVPSESIPLTIDFPEGVPDLLPPGESTGITVQIIEGSESYVPDSGTLYHRYDGGTFQTAPFVPLGGDLYRATLPAAGCGDTPEFYFSVEGTESGTLYEPPTAPADTFTAEVGVVTMILDDDFETDQGWTVENDPSLGDGAWERAVPGVDVDRGAPPEDYDGSGYCYVTDNADLGDVDGGPTRLISPIIDLSGMTDPVLTYARWFANDDEDEDRLDVEISDDDGASWVLIESVANNPAWVEQTFRVVDYVALTSQVKVRFSTADNPNNSITEAAVDAFSIGEFSCGQVECETRADMTGDGAVDGDDVAGFVACFLSGDPGSAECVCADIDGSEAFEPSDIEALVQCLLASGCP